MMTYLIVFLNTLSQTGKQCKPIVVYCFFNFPLSQKLSKLLVGEYPNLLKTPTFSRWLRIHSERFYFFTKRNLAGLTLMNPAIFYREVLSLSSIFSSSDKNLSTFFFAFISSCISFLRL